MSTSALQIVQGFQIAVSVILVMLVLLQSGEDGLGAVFGGSGGGETFRTKRGLEAGLYRGTILFAVVFVVLSGVIVKYS